MRQFALGLLILIAATLVFSAGCGEKKSDCRWAAETIFRQSDVSESIFDFCVATQLKHSGRGTSNHT